MKAYFEGYDNGDQSQPKVRPFLTLMDEPKNVVINYNKAIILGDDMSQEIIRLLSNIEDAKIPMSNEDHTAQDVRFFRCI